MSHSLPLISAENLTCIREERLLFDELSLAIYPGDIVQVEGPNGSGKTSLLRILAGLSQPYEGKVLFSNEHKSLEPITANREHFHKNLMYLGHSAGVKGEITAQENLAFYLALHGEPMNTVDDLAEQTLSEVNLLGFEDALASHLSAGQHRRIALARLWQTQTNVWILDEPFTAIDKQGVKRLEQRFLEHAENGGCVILTTHQDLSLPAERVKKVQLEYRLY